MPELPPYSGPRAVCPKCGCEVVSSRYCPGHAPFSRHGLCGHMRRDQHQQRTCRRCGYEWLEAPVDASPPNATVIRCDEYMIVLSGKWLPGDLVYLPEVGGTLGLWTTWSPGQNTEAAYLYFSGSGPLVPGMRAIRIPFRKRAGNRPTCPR